MSLASRVDALTTRLPDSDPRKAELRSRIATLSNECGCQMGGVFLVAASVVAVAYLVTRSRSLTTVVLALGFVLLLSGVGKLAGLTLAWLRLLLIGRTVERRLAMQSQVRHVDLH